MASMGTHSNVSQRERVDSFFARDDDEADDAFAARVAVLRLDDLVDKKSREQARPRRNTI